MRVYSFCELLMSYNVIFSAFYTKLTNLQFKEKKINIILRKVQSLSTIFIQNLHSSQCFHILRVLILQMFQGCTKPFSQCHHVFRRAVLHPLRGVPQSEAWPHPPGEEEAMALLRQPGDREPVVGGGCRTVVTLVEPVVKG